MYLRVGLVQMPNVRCYWEVDCRYPAVADIMSRTRLESPMTTIHFVDNTTPIEAAKKADKYWKLRPWTDALSKNCLKVTPEEYHSVDEVMVAFKGKSLFLPAKPHKWGFKLWARCGVSGFIYNSDLYQGKEPTERSASEFGMSGDVVLKLVSTLPPNRTEISRSAPTTSSQAFHLSRN